MSSTAEDDLDHVLEQLKTEMEAIGARGVRSLASDQLHWLQYTQKSLASMGAGFLACKLQRFIDSLETADGGAAERFLDLLTTIRVFQRTLTIESVHTAMQLALEATASPDQPQAVPWLDNIADGAHHVQISVAEQKKLLPMLSRTVSSLEELLLTGLTTASTSTHQILGVTFQEASRLKLLRLGATLRATCDEIQRYTQDDSSFSTQRLMFFVNRSWLLCKGLQRAFEHGDVQAVENLLWHPPHERLDSIQVVCLGVIKKIAAAFCAFEFRLRNIANGQPLIWSTVFPMKSGTSIPAEGFLHLPQKQKFVPTLFLERRVVHIEQLVLAQPQLGPARIQLLEESRVVAGEAYSDWGQWLIWDMQAAALRLQHHRVTPFDVDAELHEELAVDSYQLDATGQERAERITYPLIARGLACQLSISSSLEGETARVAIEGLLNNKKSQPTLFGLMHYANSRPVVQPLSLFSDGQPQYITISDKAIDRKALLSAMKFT